MVHPGQHHDTGDPQCVAAGLRPGDSLSDTDREICPSVSGVPTQPLGVIPPITSIRPMLSVRVEYQWCSSRGSSASAACSRPRHCRLTYLCDQFGTTLAPRGLHDLRRRGVRGAISARCRSHLLADLRTPKPVDLSWQQPMLEQVSVRLARYQTSFVAGADEPSDQDRVALIVAMGWCTGWRPLLTLLS
jgi:hypothetical protein